MEGEIDTENFVSKFRASRWREARQFDYIYTEIVYNFFQHFLVLKHSLSFCKGNLKVEILKTSGFKIIRENDDRF